MGGSRQESVDIKKIGSGVAGLDDVLEGGVPAGRLYLLEGDPGTGKTTLAIQFLLDGTRAGERVAFITLSESQIELTASAASHGWSLDGVEIREYVASADALAPDGQVTMFRPSEVELLETVRQLLHDIEAINPDRVVVDSLSELRLLAQDSFRYRRQLLALKEFFLSRQCTVLLLDDRTAGDRDRHVQSIVHASSTLSSSRLITARSGGACACRRYDIVPEWLARLRHPTRRSRSVSAAHRSRSPPARIS